MRSVVRSSTRVVVPLIAVISVAASCLAWNGDQKKLCDGHTRYMWSRTWHAQNSIDQPLGPYFMPRTPGHCRSDYKPGDMAATVPSQYGGAPYPAAAVVSFEPLQFERLGKVANELDVAGSLGAPAGGTAPAGAHR